MGGKGLPLKDQSIPTTLPLVICRVQNERCYDIHRLANKTIGKIQKKSSLAMLTFLGFFEKLSLTLFGQTEDVLFP